MGYSPLLARDGDHFFPYERTAGPHSERPNCRAVSQTGASTFLWYKPAAFKILAEPATQPTPTCGEYRNGLVSGRLAKFRSIGRDFLAPNADNRRELQQSSPGSAPLLLV